MGIFNPENDFWQFIAKIADVLMLSVAWLFLSLPVVTLGAATAGLYDAAVKCVLEGRNGTMVRFWETFRRELRSSLLPTLLWGGVCALLIAGVWAVRSRVVFEGAAAVVLLAVWYAVLLVPVGCLCWMFPLLSRFTFDAKGLITTALRFTLGYFPRTLLIVVMAVAGVIAGGWLLVPMLVAPALVALGWAGLMEPVFQKYMPAPPGSREEREEE